MPPDKPQLRSRDRHVDFSIVNDRLYLLIFQKNNSARTASIDIAIRKRPTATVLEHATTPLENTVPAAPEVSRAIIVLAPLTEGFDFPASHDPRRAARLSAPTSA